MSCTPLFFGAGKLTTGERKQYKTQSSYCIAAVPSELYSDLHKNRNLRSVRIIEKNGQLHFYLTGAKEVRANCVIYSRGKMTILHVRDWQRERIEKAVKGAMEEAGYVIDDSTFKLVKKVIPFDERERAYKYDHVMLILNLIPGLMEKLRKIKTSWLTLVDYPYLVLFDPIIEAGRKAVLTVRPTVEDANKILEFQLSCSDNNSRKSIKRILKKKIISAGLAMGQNDSSVDRLIVDEFFDEDERTRCCSQNISLEVVHEGRIGEVSRLETLGAKKWRIRI